MDGAMPLCSRMRAFMRPDFDPANRRERVVHSHTVARPPAYAAKPGGNLLRSEIGNLLSEGRATAPIEGHIEMGSCSAIVARIFRDNSVEEDAGLLAGERDRIHRETLRRDSGELDVCYIGRVSR